MLQTTSCPLTTSSRCWARIASTRAASTSAPTPRWPRRRPPCWSYAASGRSWRTGSRSVGRAAGRWRRRELRCILLPCRAWPLAGEGSPLCSWMQPTSQRSFRRVPPTPLLTSRPMHPFRLPCAGAGAGVRVGQLELVPGGEVPGQRSDGGQQQPHAARPHPGGGAVSGAGGGGGWQGFSHIPFWCYSPAVPLHLCLPRVRPRSPCLPDTLLAGDEGCPTSP